MTKPAAENSTKEQRGRPFVKGQSGNPKGKPKGVRNRLTLAAEALLDGEAETITRKAVELAKDGDMTAIRLWRAENGFLRQRERRCGIAGSEGSR